MNSDSKFFAQDDAFWANYIRGRPIPPTSFFDRIFTYHASHGGRFATAHDVGAGVAPFAPLLRARFARVLVSDIVPANITSASARLGAADSGYAFRTAALDDDAGVPPGSVDLVFASNVMHFADPQPAAMAALARQLRPGGTFAAALFGPARLADPALGDLWRRISEQGGRELLRAADDPEATIRVMARTEGPYNVAPLDPALWLPGAQRVHLNMGKGGIQGMLPPEEAHRVSEPSHTGAEDVEVWEEEEGWAFETDLAGLKGHFETFPFVSRFPEAMSELYAELEELMADGRRAVGWFPAKIILATRR